MRTRRRLSTLLVTLVAMGGIAACGEDDDVAPNDRGESPSAVGEPGEDASETGGGGTPAEGVEDQNEEN